MVPCFLKQTDPVTGFKTFGYDFKKYFVSQLIAQKLIHKKELDRGIDEVFNEHYFIGDPITLRELIGVQYSNRGILEMKENEFRKAFNNFEKAYLLYPNEDTRTLLFSALTNQLQVTNYADWDDIKLLAKIPRYESFDINYLGVLSGFDKINQYYHIDRNDTTTFKKAFELVRKDVPKPHQVEIDYLYNYERARVLYNRGDYLGALRFTLNAFQVKPNNAEIEILLLNNFRQFLRAPENEMEVAIKLLDAIMLENEQIATNRKFGGLRLDFSLIQMSNAYYNEQDEQGLTHHQKFLDLAADHPDFQFDPYIVGRAFSTAVYYYVKSGQLPTANSLLSQGLNYAPYNVELINSKSLLKR